MEINAAMVLVCASPSDSALEDEVGPLDSAAAGGRGMEMWMRADVEVVADGNGVELQWWLWGWKMNRWVAAVDVRWKWRGGPVDGKMLSAWRRGSWRWYMELCCPSSGDGDEVEMERSKMGPSRREATAVWYECPPKTLMVGAPSLVVSNGWPSAFLFFPSFPLFPCKNLGNPPAEPSLLYHFTAP